MSASPDYDAADRKAQEMTLKDLGEAVGKIGFSRPFSDYTREEALFIVTEVIRGYHKNIRSICHEDIPF